ncbi:MAG: alpha/beta hydrolase [Pseudomonadota bacterium]
MKLIATPLNPVPYGGTVLRVPGDGPALRAAVWPADGEASGTVIIMTGRSEYIERYFETVADLRRRRYGVVVFDWRGQGGSERLLSDTRKGHVASFRHYEADVMRVFQHVVAGALPEPYIALAHSMGGNVALRIGARADCPFSRIVASAPLVAIHPKRIGVPEPVAYGFAQSMRAIGLGNRFVPGGKDASFEHVEFPENELTHDQKRFERNREIAEIAPELAVGDPTIAWLGSALSSCRDLGKVELVRRIRVPVLLCTAERDRIVWSQATERLADMLPVGRCLTMPGAEHELLQETDAVRARFFSALDAFMTREAASAV